MAIQKCVIEAKFCFFFFILISKSIDFWYYKLHNFQFILKNALWICDIIAKFILIRLHLKYDETYTECENFEWFLFDITIRLKMFIEIIQKKKKKYSKHEHMKIKTEQIKKRNISIN